MRLRGGLWGYAVLGAAAACTLTTSLDGYTDGIPVDEGASTDAAPPPDVAVVADDGSTTSDATAADADAGPSYPEIILSDSPVGYWRLGEASGTMVTDETGNHNGTYGGGVTFGQPGVVPGDTAVLFDGTTAYADLGSIFPFPGTAPYTLEAWVKPAQRSKDQRIVSHRPTPNDGYRLMLTATNKTMSDRVVDASTIGLVQGPEAPLSAFTHLVATYDGATFAFYVNGSKVDSSSAPAPMPNLSSNVVIGSTSTKANEFFAGVIDEVAVYDKALPAARILAHYAAGKP